MYLALAADYIKEAIHTVFYLSNPDKRPTIGISKLIQGNTMAV